MSDRELQATTAVVKYHRHYVSTACLHAVEESNGRLAAALHERCRLTCKYCQAPCRCACHRPRQVAPVAEIAPVGAVA